LLSNHQLLACLSIDHLSCYPELPRDVRSSPSRRLPQSAVRLQSLADQEEPFRVCRLPRRLEDVTVSTPLPTRLPCHQILAYRLRPGRIEAEALLCPRLLATFPPICRKKCLAPPPAPRPRNPRVVPPTILRSPAQDSPYTATL
jgi:hypothetical protein